MSSHCGAFTAAVLLSVRATDADSRETQMKIFFSQHHTLLPLNVFKKNRWLQQKLPWKQKCGLQQVFSAHADQRKSWGRQFAQSVKAYLKSTEQSDACNETSGERENQTITTILHCPTDPCDSWRDTSAPLISTQWITTYPTISANVTITDSLIRHWHNMFLFATVLVNKCTNCASTNSKLALKYKALHILWCMLKATVEYSRWIIVCCAGHCACNY